MKGLMDTRLLELALEALIHKKAGIELEIAALKSDLEDRTLAKPTTPPAGRRRKRTAAERRAQSKKMKAIWAAKRAARKTGKARAKAKSGPQNAAARAAVSKRMREYWKKRKAAAAKGGKKSS